MAISVGRFQPVNTPTVIRSLLQQFPCWYPFIPCFTRMDLFTRPNSRLSITDMTDRFPSSPLRLSRRMISPVCFLYASRTSNHLSTCSPPSFLLSFSIQSILVSLSLPITLSLHGIINISVRCCYLHNPVDSIFGFSCTEGNRTEPSRTEHAWCSDNDGGYGRSGFYFLPSRCS